MKNDFKFSPDSAHVALSIPEPVEIADYIPNAADIEAMKKAQEKRDRKKKKDYMNKLAAFSTKLYGKDDNSIDISTIQ